MPTINLQKLVLESKQFNMNDLKGLNKREIEALMRAKKTATSVKDFMKKAAKISAGAVAAVALFYGISKSGGDSDKGSGSPPETTQAEPKRYVQLPAEVESRLDDRTAMNINSILREIGTTAPSEIELIAKFVRYKQARPFASRWNAGQWAVDIQNAAKYLGISGETVQALDIAWDRSGCK